MDIKKRKFEEEENIQKIDLNNVYDELSLELNMLKLKTNNIENIILENEENKDLREKRIIKIEKDVQKINSNIENFTGKLDKMFLMMENLNKKMFDKLNEIQMENDDLKHQLKVIKEENEFFEKKEKEKEKNDNNLKDNFSFYS